MIKRQVYCFLRHTVETICIILVNAPDSKLNVIPSSYVRHGALPTHWVTIEMRQLTQINLLAISLQNCVV